MKTSLYHQWIARLVAVALLFALAAPGWARAEAEEMTVSLRVEGIEKTILDANSISLHFEEGKPTAYDALIYGLKERNIPYVETELFDMPYIRSIDGVEEGTFGGYDGWLYKIVRNGKLDPSADDYALSQFQLESGDELIVYYGDWGIPVAHISISHSPTDPNDPGAVAVYDLATGEPIPGATVYIGNEQAIADEQGQVSLPSNLSGSLAVYAEKLDDEGKPLVVRSKKTTLTIPPPDGAEDSENEEDPEQPNEQGDTAIEEAIDKLLSYYRSKGTPTSDWAVFGLNALGEDVNRGPYASEDRSFADEIAEREYADGHPTTIGNVAKTILSILSLGYDPTSFANKNWVKQLQNQPEPSLIHQAMFGLIALDAAGAIDSAHEKLLRDNLIDNILNSNRYGDAWGYGSIDPDTTAMALYALAPHRNDREDVKQAINKAVEALRSIQQADGGFGNSSSTIEVIQALTILGIDPRSEAFTKENGQNPVSYLLAHQLDNGAFSFTKGGTANGMATEKALIALAALKQFDEKGEANLYTNIHYAGGTPPKREDAPATDEKPFEISSASLSWNGGIYANATVARTDETYNEPVYIVFQLRKDEQPLNIVALKETIIDDKEATAFFNVSQDAGYEVDVFVIDRLNEKNSVGTPLAKRATLRESF